MKAKEIVTTAKIEEKTMLEGSEPEGTVNHLPKRGAEDEEEELEEEVQTGGEFSVVR